MDWIIVLSAVSGLLTQYCHQTIAVADSSYPVTKPPAEVSVIIPAYNESAFIEQALLSVYSQNVVLEYPEMFEVIVVDNGSIDTTAEIASKYAKVVASPRGKLNAKNVGAAEAQGEMLVFMDADSIAKPNCFNLLLRHFHKPNVVAVGGVIQCLDTDIFYTIAVTQSNMINGILVNHLNAGLSAVRKDAFFAVGGHITEGVDQFEVNSIMQEEERAFLFRLKSIGKVVVDSEATIWVYHRKGKCTQCTYPQSIGEAYCRYCKEVESGERF